MIRRFVFGAFAALSLAAHASGIPQQSQAAEIAAPGVDALPYASAFVVVQCHAAVAVVLIDHQGHPRPLHLKDLTQAMLLNELSQVPADATWQVEVPCPGELRT